MLYIIYNISQISPYSYSIDIKLFHQQVDLNNPTGLSQGDAVEQRWWRVRIHTTIANG